MRKSAVILRSIVGRNLDDVVTEILEFCLWRDIIPKNGTVVIKPNLCTERPEMIQCANTSIELLRSVCGILKTQTDEIIIGESDGMRYKAEQAMENTGVYEAAKELGVKTINFSRDELVEVGHPLLRGWGFSKTYLDADVFISIPTLKTHATTVFTGALKNQWGCIPRYDRVLLHKYLDTLIVDVNKVKTPHISIMDGIVAMEGRGPANGNPVHLNVLLGSADPVALDATSMRLVGLDPLSSKHVRLAAKEGLGKIDPQDILIDGNFEELKTEIEPAERDWAIKIMNMVTRSNVLTRNLMLNDSVFYPMRRIVLALRGEAR